MEKLFRRWFVALHGEGEPHQYDFYRCASCGNLLTWNRIRSGSRCCAGRAVPAEPKWWEAALLFVWPWKFHGRS